MGLLETWLGSIPAYVPSLSPYSRDLADLSGQ